MPDPAGSPPCGYQVIRNAPHIAKPGEGTAESAVSADDQQRWVLNSQYYVAEHPDRLIGFLSVDPTQPGWQDELEEGHGNLKLKGIKLLSMPCVAHHDSAYGRVLPSGRCRHRSRCQTENIREDINHDADIVFKKA